MGPSATKKRPNFNNLVIAGRLVADPESCLPAMTGSGGLWKFCLIGDQWGKDNPLLLDCTFGRTDIFNTCKQLKKGYLVLVQGRLILDQWIDKVTGSNSYRHRCVVYHVTLLSVPKGQTWPKGLIDTPANPDPRTDDDRPPHFSAGPDADYDPDWGDSPDVDRPF